MKYEIDNNNAVSIYKEDSEVPMVFQPDWPDGTPWANKAEAEAWAKQTILALEDDTADWAGVSPAEPTQKRPEPEMPLDLSQSVELTPEL